MSIISISRGSYYRGKEVAEKLAAELGYECLSREILLEASDQYNISEIKLQKALHDAPSILERYNHSKDRYIRYFKSAFLSHIAKGNVVYHGLAGHFFLQDAPHVLKVKVNAKMKDRVADEMKREGCSQQKAEHSLLHDDEERRKWGLHLYGLDPWDSRLFDFVCMVDTLKVDDIVHILLELTAKEQFQETAETRAEMNRQAKEAAVIALVYDYAPHARIEFTAKDKIELQGLRNDYVTMNKLEKILHQEFGFDEIIIKKTSKPTGHINNFHNI